ncbi:hypothetical protein ACFQ0O_26480 [Saccharopolyspora spinosporotrichia]
MRFAAALAVLAALALLVWANRKDIPEAARALRTADGHRLSLAVLLLLVWWLNWTLLHAAARRVVGVGGYAELGRLVPVTLSSIALNLAVKSGNVAGLASFAYDARQRGLPREGSPRRTWPPPSSPRSPSSSRWARESWSCASTGGSPVPSCSPW